MSSSISHFSNKYFKFFYIFLITIAIWSIQTINAHGEAFNFSAQSYILIDSKTGQILAENNADSKLYPASTTKIMTGILAIEMGNPDHLMTVSKAAITDIGKDGMHIGLEPGETIKLADLLKAMLIRSGNDTANVIAENLSPTRGEFVELMNKRAIELGATSTNFVNPNGKDSDKDDILHQSTAADMVKLARYAMTLPKFRELVSTKEFRMPASNKHPAEYWPKYSTTNKTLLYEKYKSPAYSFIGTKTGYTSKGGNNLVSTAVSENGMELIAAVMGVKNAPTDSVFLYSKQLMDYGFSNFSIQTYAQEGQVIKSVPVGLAEDGSAVDLVLEKSMTAVLPNDKDSWNLGIKENINPQVTAPVNKGDVLGWVEYTRNGSVLGKVNLVASASVDTKAILLTSRGTGNSWFFSALRLFASAASIIVSFLLLRLILRKVSRSLNAKKRASIGS